MTRRDLLKLAAAASFLPADDSPTSRLVHEDADGRLVYQMDELGNRIPDFSMCGYMASAGLPNVQVRAVVEPEPGDMTEKIQRAIDEVSRMEFDESGFRGAVLLSRGRHSVAGTLRVGASGVVLRGEGPDTVLFAACKRQRTVIELRGASFGRGTVLTAVADEYVPVGAMSLTQRTETDLIPGNTILVRRIANAAWIHEIGMDRITPRPDDPSSTVQWRPFNLDFERRVVAIDGAKLTLDAPITCAIEQRWGGGQILRFNESSRLSNVGVEYLRGVSEFDPAVRKTLGGESYHADEQHAWSLVGIENSNNAWVRNVTAEHFGFACVDIAGSRWVTVQACECSDMVSEIIGSRRYSFNVQGQLCLIERCKADTGRHDWVVGARIAGPNVFLRCESGRTYATSEPHHRWSVGGLYDNVKAPIAIQDRQWYGSGHGWSGANYVAWNCELPLVCQRPPTANNWAIGHVGPKQKGAFEPRQDGYWESHGQHVRPQSLYERQRQG